MSIRIKTELTKSLSNPYNEITNKTGTIIQMVGDGYYLIEFDDIYYKNGLLQWYVHEQDFYINNKF